MTEKLLLVPVDFSTVSKAQFSHAHHIAEKIEGTLHLLHLIDKDKERDAAEKALSTFVGEMQAVYGTSVKIKEQVLKGNILKDIGEQAESLKATLVVLGTHGLQGIEHLVGTHAVRIIGTADVPFIVVQEKPIGPTGYDNILVPMGLEAEDKQKLSLVAQMAKLFKAQVHLAVPHETDEFLTNALTRNLNYAKQFFAKENVSYTATVASEESDDRDETVFEVGKQKNADLIAIMNWRETKVLGMFGGDDTQEILINKDMTPVLVLNPRAISGGTELFGIYA